MNFIYHSDILTLGGPAYTPSEYLLTPDATVIQPLKLVVLLILLRVPSHPKCNCVPLTNFIHHSDILIGWSCLYSVRVPSHPRCYCVPLTIPI